MLVTHAPIGPSNRYLPDEELYLETVQPRELEDASVDNENRKRRALELRPPRTPLRS